MRTGFVCAAERQSTTRPLGMGSLLPTLKIARLEASRQILLIGLVLQMGASAARSEQAETKGLDGSALMQLAFETDNNYTIHYILFACLY